MRSGTICKLCNKDLGKHHGLKQPLEFMIHFQEDHPKEYKEIHDAHKRYVLLRLKYKYQGYG